MYWWRLQDKYDSITVARRRNSFVPVYVVGRLKTKRWWNSKYRTHVKSLQYFLLH